jgi:hypothetical protein
VATPVFCPVPSAGFSSANLIRPRQKLSRALKQQRLSELEAQSHGPLTIEHIDHYYREVVNPGFVGKAAHALKLCFPERADEYINECFRKPKIADRRYDIRNAINHGDIDSEDPDELVRVESRLSRLGLIVLGMFGRLIPFPAPVDP